MPNVLHRSAVVDGVDADRHADRERRDQLLGGGTIGQQPHPEGDGDNGDDAEWAEVVVEQDHPAEGGEDGAAATRDGVGDREVTVLVGVGEQQQVRDVDQPRSAVPAPTPRREIPRDEQNTAPPINPPTMNCADSAVTRSALRLATRFHAACSPAAASARTVATNTAAGRAGAATRGRRRRRRRPPCHRRRP